MNPKNIGLFQQFLYMLKPDRISTYMLFFHCMNSVPLTNNQNFMMNFTIE